MSWRSGVWLLALVACEAPLGEMSPQTVDEITKSVGDAEGFARSGLYLVEVELLECPCADMMVPAGPMPEGLSSFSICAAVGGAPGTATIDARVVATDGIVTFEVAGADATDLVGPLNEGGGFNVGAVTTLSSVVARGQLIVRMDGDFDALQGDRHEFEALLRNRIAGTTTIDTTSNRIDCTEELLLEGTFAQPL